MVSKNFNKIIQEIKNQDEKAIQQKDVQSLTLQHLQEIKEDKFDIKQESNPIASKMNIEQKNEIKEETKEDPKEEMKEEKFNNIKIEKEEKEENDEELKDKSPKKKKKHKKKPKNNTKIFEVPQTNPYRNIFDFKEVTKIRFQDNSIFRVINNWEEKEWYQTSPPTKDIDEQFPTQLFPQGEIQPYLK